MNHINRLEQYLLEIKETRKKMIKWLALKPVRCGLM